MTEPIRILHVIGIMNRGGAETMIMNLYRNIDRTKVQFDFVENQGETAAFDQEILALGGRIYKCPRYRGKNHFAYVQWWKAFFEEYKSEYPIVHGHIGSTAAIYLAIAKKYGAFAIAHSHSAGKGSAMYQVLSWPTRYVADQFFACSKDAGISRYGKAVGKNENKCRMLRNAIDVERFRFDAARRDAIRGDLGIEADALVVGHVGRFVEVKNHLFLLDVFEEVVKQNSHARLLLVGDGELRPRIEEAITGKQLQDRVILTGIRSNTWDYYQAMDVFVMPSVFEGVPVSLVEAQTAGLPCCVSSGIPLDAAITDLVQYQSLEVSPEKWAQWVLDRAAYPRRNMKETMERAGYDIHKTAGWLEDYYLKLVKDHA